MLFPGETRKVSMIDPNHQIPSYHSRQRAPSASPNGDSPRSPYNPGHSFPAPRLTINGAISMNSTLRSEHHFPSSSTSYNHHEDAPEATNFFDNGRNTPSSTPHAPGEAECISVPEQPTIVYQPVTPPSSVRLKAWRRYMYARDGFREPFDDTATATDTGPAGMCIICYYSVLGSGEIMQTIMKIYNDNIGFLNVAQVYRIIMTYWNKYVAGEEVAGEDEDDDESSDSDDTGDGEDNDPPSIYVEPIDDENSGSEAEEVSGAESDAAEADNGVDDEDIECEDDDEDDITSQSDTDNGDTPKPQTTNTTLPSKKSMASTTTTARRHTVPKIKMACVDYHFTHCYREQNGHRLIFDQMHKLIEIQDTIYQNGLFCKRQKVVGDNTSLPTVLPPPPAAFDPCAPEPSSQPSVTDLVLAKDILKELGNKIQEEVLHITELRNRIRQTEACTGVRSRDTRDLIFFLKTSSDEKEGVLKVAINRFESMSKRIAIAEQDIKMAQTAPNGSTEEEICVKMREAILVQSLGRSIISLLDKTNNYQRKRTHVPFGQTTEEYYRNVSLTDTQGTANDRIVVQTRQRNFQLNNSHLNPNLLNMTKQLYKATPHSDNFTSIGTDPTDQNGTDDAANAVLESGEFKVGGTAVRNREFTSYRQSRRPDKPLRKRSRFEIE